jgi:hypothetical protein
MPNTHKNPLDWPSIIANFAQTTQSGAAYCRQHHLPYASFCKYRLALSQSNPNVPSSAPAFIDLAALTAPQNAAGLWRITLKLGNGVELQLSQTP